MKVTSVSSKKFKCEGELSVKCPGRIYLDSLRGYKVPTCARFSISGSADHSNRSLTAVGRLDRATNLTIP